MVSQKTRYALRAALVIAERGKSGPVQIGDIAETAKIPSRYLETVLLELRKHGLLRSIRGPHGGYMLAKDSGSISFADILNISEGPTEDRHCAECFGDNRCRIREALREAQKASQKILASYTLAGA